MSAPKTDAEADARLMLIGQRIEVMTALVAAHVASGNVQFTAGQVLGGFVDPMIDKARAIADLIIAKAVGP